MLSKITRLGQAGCLAAAMFAAGSAQAETYIRFDGAPMAKIPADSVSFNVSRTAEYDMETGAVKQPQVFTTSGGPLYISRSLDAASPAIVDAVVNGKSAKGVEVHMINTDEAGKAKSETVWILKDAVFNNYNVYQTVDTSPTESFDISYSEATLNVFTADEQTGAIAKTPVTTVTWSPTPDYTAMPVDH